MKYFKLALLALPGVFVAALTLTPTNQLLASESILVSRIAATLPNPEPVNSAINSQPAHSLKLVHQPGTSGYQAFCCHGLIEENSGVTAEKPESLNSSPEEMLPLDDVTVYPNPATDYVIVKNARGANLYLFTCMGKQIFFSTVNNEQPIDIKAVPCGCYTLKLELGNRFRSVQLLVRR